MDSLGDRMKVYENVPRISLTRRMPVIVRVDGKAFHSFTKGFQKPFDGILMASMADTAQYLCENVMNCKLAYTQSDEISLLLVDYGTVETQAWFENSLQKIVSVAASMATMAFNKAFGHRVFERTEAPDYDGCDDLLMKAYFKRIDTAMFDARAFVLPREEVCNYFIWRQQDAVRNSIQMLAQSMFSHKELHGKSCPELQDMMHEKGVNWNDLPTCKKQGHCVIKEAYDHDGTQRTRWVSDANMPVITKDRDYIDKYVNI